MNITVNRKMLASELKFLQGSVARRTYIQILGSVLMSAADGRLDLTTTDLDIFSGSALSADVQAAGSAAVNYKALNELVKKLKGETLTLSLEEHGLVVSQGPFKMTLDVFAVEDFPVLPQVPVATMLLDCDKFQRGVSRVRFSISKNEGHFFRYDGMLMRRDPEGNIVIAGTDGNRLSYERLDCVVGDAGPGDVKDVIVHRDALPQLLALGGPGIAVSHAEQHVAFVSNHRRVIVRLPESHRYPQVERILEPNPLHAVFNRAALIESLTRILPFSDQREHAVIFDFGENAVTMLFPSGGMTSELPCQYGGDVIRTVLNCEYLVEALSVLDSEHVCFGLRDNDSKVTLRPVDNRLDTVHVVMPIRL